MPTDRTIDGTDIAPLLLGHPGAGSPHDRFFYQQGGQLAAVRSGDWKLFLNGELYNLKSDLAESNNIASAHPDVVDKLKTMLSEFQVDIQNHSRPVGFAATRELWFHAPESTAREGFRPTLSLPQGR